MYFERKVSYSLLFICLLLISSLCLMHFQFGSAANASYSFSITTEYYGANAGEIELVITIPIEDGIGDIPGIKKIQSTSEFAKSRIIVATKPGTDMNLLYTDIKERVDRVRVSFPKAVQKTRIASSDSTNHPVFIVSFKSDIMGLPELGEYVETEIKPQYQRVRGTGEIETGGQGIQDILVRMDHDKAALYGVDSSTISRLLQDSYVRMPAGEIRDRKESIPIFFDSQINDIDDFKKLELRTGKGSSIKLSEVASVSRQYRTDEQVSRIDGEEKIILYIYSGGNTNTLKLCESLGKTTNSLRTKGYRADIIYNKGDEIKKSINNILVSMAISMISLFLFIGLFLPDIKARLLLSASIPLSIFLCIAGLSAFRIPIDASIISGLTIGSGLIIDNYLIIYDYITGNKGKSISSIVKPLLAGTLTTLIVFLPLLTLHSLDISVQSISFSICGMLVISQFLIFTFLPPPLKLLSAHSVKRKSLISFDTVAKPFFFLTDISLSHKRATRILYLLIIASVPIFLFFGQKEFTPIDNDGILFVHVEFPSGTTIAEVDKDILPYVKQFRKVPYVKLVESNSKRGNAQISVTFDNEKIDMADLQKTLESITQNCTRGQFFYGLDQNTQSYKIYFTLTGDDHELLRKKVKDIGETFSKQEWVTGVVYHFKENPPAYVYRPSSSRLSAYGIYPERIAAILRWNVQGPVTLKWINDRKEHDVRVKGVENDISLFDLGAFPAIMQDSISMPLSGLGKFSETSEPDSLYRENRQKSISFTVQTKRLGLNRIHKNIYRLMQSISLPAGYGLFPDSSMSDSMNNYKSMYLVFLLAVFLIYALLAIQNESFILPVLILSAIPFSAFFPLTFLAMLHKPITSASIIGIIILSGTSVNNFILIMDAVRNFPGDECLTGKIRSALRKRFNPLFLSCGTSVIAAIPILFASKPFSDFPSALAIIITLGVAGSFVGSFLFLPAIVDIFLRTPKKSGDALK